MPTADKYGQQLQAWFQREAATEGRSAHDAQKAVGCSRQRVYQWLATGAVDVIGTGEMSARGAKLYQYVPGAKDRPTAGVGRRAGQMPASSSSPAASHVHLLDTQVLAMTATEAAHLMGQEIQVVGMHVDQARGVVLDCRDADGRVWQLANVAVV